MPYGKTVPVEYVCATCGAKRYGMRRNKKMAKVAIKKYCNTERSVQEFKPKECKHST
ncbi:MAG TPA: 50S ribosomal protein L33 [Candidatus Gracilibacteria bacterium]|nr:50S ribosomal protein L33 [Candidatus Gracilibacteria bacterium]